MRKNGKSYLFSLLTMCILLLAIGCQEKPDKPRVETVKAPEQIISTEQAQELFDNYSHRRVPLIQKYEDSLNPSTKFDVARYGYYDYKTIKKYIAYIEQEAERADVEISTLRFYFGNYPNKFNDGQSAKHPRQNSFFLAPTLKQDGKEFPFSVVSDGKGNYRPKLLTNNFKLREKGIGAVFYKQNRSNASFFPNIFDKPVFFQDDDASLILNESNMIPPPY